MDVIALLLALGLVALNGFFVATEFAIVKVRPTRIEELLRKRRPGAAAARHVIGHIDQYLSATQLGITLASLGLGWIGEPAFASLLEAPLALVGVTDPEWIHRITLPVAFVMISVLHIVAGELAPKSLAIMRAETVALNTAYPIRIFYAIFYPAIVALNSVANALLRLIGLSPSQPGFEHHHSEEEIKLIISQARSAGLLSASRGDLLHKVLSLPHKTARSLMVPRNEVIFLDLQLPLEDNLERAMRSGHTRFPVCTRELDDVIGFIDIRDLLYHHARDNQPDLRSMAKPLAYIPETMPAERMLRALKARRTPMAVIVDEYGGTSGIATTTDVVEAVMGGIEESDDTDVVRLPSGAYDVEGTAVLEDIEQALGISLQIGEMRTVAGFLMARLGRMPRVGDRVRVDHYVFLIMDVSGPKVRRVRIQNEAPAHAPQTSPHAPSLPPPPTSPAPPV